MIKKLKQLAKSGFSLLVRIIILAVVVYILFNIGRSIWKNWQTNREIKRSEEAISQLEEDVQDLQNQILYYKTDAFKELEARRRLGLKKPDENVALVPENTDKGKSQTPPGQSAKNQEANSAIPNPLKWWNYIMGK